MARFILDGSRIATREEFWQAYIDTVEPEGAEFFGRNLAALNDALWGGPGWPGDDFVLHISATDALTFRLGADFISHLRDIFGDSHGSKLELA